MFSQHLHIRPWEIPLLTIAQFERLIDYAEEHLIKGD